MTQPQTTESAETQDPGEDEPGIVRHVAPTQVTSPAVAPQDGAASAEPEDSDGPADPDRPDDSGGLDDKAGVADNGGGTDD
jgi:hypothetical protein